jgi:RNA polymerase sigma-70 factor (ECF subfamily)
MKQTDEQLVVLYKDGDDESLQILIERHLRLVFNMAYRYTGSISDAEDISQDAFVKAWKGIGSFDIKRKFKPWLLSITRNTIRDWLRSKRPLLFSALETDARTFEEMLADDAPLPDEEADMLLANAGARKAALELPAAQQIILWLRNDEDLTFQEISEILHEPLNTVKSRFRRAIETLRKALPDQDAPK